MAAARAPRPPDPISADPPQTEIITHSAFGVAGDIGMLANGGGGFQGPDLIIQGRVTGTRVFQVPRPSIPPKNGITFPTSDPFTAFTVEVSEVVVATDGTPPPTITFAMPGAVVDGRRRVIEELPLVEVGQEYVLLLMRRGDGNADYEIIGPQGYLRVKGGTVEPVVGGIPVVEGFRDKDGRAVKQQLKDAKRK